MRGRRTGKSMRRWVLALVLSLGVSAPFAHAHHSIAGMYDTGEEVTIEGIVAELRFRNPHPILIVNVGDAGSVTQWLLEMDNRRELTRIGMTSETLRPGDRVIVIGNPSRRVSQRVYIRRLDRPADGFGYEQVGNSPRINTPSR